ncbi:MAG: polyprenyl synthetase family protein [Phycisphaerales bacterium]|nr:polyprenyl synthetase family protein [Phycisphaerales bacterium]
MTQQRGGPVAVDLTEAGLFAAVPRVEAFMDAYVASLALPRNLLEAVRYALLGGGKRLRPVLASHCCAAVGGDFEAGLPAAAAVEMIHAFSLAHDDLPALDNDDLRRGRPTLHIAHGHAMAILAGDGLMSLAFQMLAERCADPELAGRLSRELAIGNTAMIAGQVLDTLGGFDAGLDARARLEAVHRNKTGALIRAACRMGAIGGMWARGVDDALLATVTAYGEAVGLMFQIVDDLLDVEQTAEHTGKRTAKDEQAGKLTYPAVLGIEGSRKEIERLRQVARSAAETLGASAAPLATLADVMARRTK